MSISVTHPARSATQAAVAASAWPATAAAADAELACLAEPLAEAGVTALRAAGIPGFAAGPGDTADIRVRTTSNPPHAPHASARSAFAHLHPFIEAAARPCDGCGAEAGAPCNLNCLPDPSND